MPLAQQWEKLLLQSMAAGGAYRFTPRNSSNALSAGSRIGRRAGNSLEFLEHREYRPGDDLRLVDWNVYARSNSWVVKRFQEEITPILDLIVDGSVSMLMPDLSIILFTLMSNGAVMNTSTVQSMSLSM